MHRRTYIRFAGGATVLTLAGCASNENDTTDTSNAANDPGTETPNQDQTPASTTTTPTPTPTPTSTSEERVLVDETIFSRNRYPFDLQSGQGLEITVDVKRGGPVIVDVADLEGGESLFSDRVITKETFEVAIQTTGPHYITFQNVTEAIIQVLLFDRSN